MKDKTHTQAEVLEIMMVRDNADYQLAIQTALGLFESSNLSLQEFILTEWPWGSPIGEPYNLYTGGGCNVSCLPMDNGQLFTVTEECACIYANESDFWECEGDKFIEYFTFTEGVTNED